MAGGDARRWRKDSCRIASALIFTHQHHDGRIGYAELHVEADASGDDAAADVAGDGESGEAIGRYPEIGTLSEGQIADVAVFDLRTGVFAFKDAWHNKLVGTKKLECVMTIRAGSLLYDREGRGFPEWNKAGEYEVIP